MYNEKTYWITLSQINDFGTKKIFTINTMLNELQISIEDLYNLTQTELVSIGLSSKDAEKIIHSKNNLGNNAFLYERLLNEGYEIFSFLDADYPKLLIENLGIEYVPTILYLKGNNGILKEKSIAIVGSRNASDISFNFVDKIAQKATAEFKVVVSGFAKGVDKRALDSTLAINGQSIIVLPQGILTFNKGFSDYHKHIVNGNLLVISAFYPNSGWNVSLAMIRNAYIYGLAEEIFIAESDTKGGTYQGAKEWLKKKRKVYIRIPNENEKNGNKLIIKMGAIPVNESGNAVNFPNIDTIATAEELQIPFSY